MEEDLLIKQEDLDNITEEELDELESVVDEYIELCSDFESDIDDILERVNNSDVYEKLGKELHISIEYIYSVGTKDK